jgi:hypothetical protein
MRVALLVVLEIVGLVALLIFAATIAIPFAAPPPTRPTPTLPPGVFLDCPHSVPGCR